MRESTTATPSGALDLLRVIEIHARYHDLIDRYVRNRVVGFADADEIVHLVFRRAALDLGDVPEPALPWLIATARHECARALRDHLEAA